MCITYKRKYFNCWQRHLLFQYFHNLQNEPKPEAAAPIPTTVHNLEINDEDKLNSPSEERLEDLTQRLEASEMEAQRLSDALEQMSAQKSAVERDISSMQNENQRLQVENEALGAEKWELSAANADLQNRLQAVSYMQVSES